MKRPALLLFAAALIAASPLQAQRTDLSGLKFCIDPGHGGHNAANDRYVVPEPGTEFWESESNFKKAMRLDTLLTERGAWVILTRYTNDYPNDEEPSLTARWTLANANNVNWFHSIHSNATGWTTNTTVDYTLILVKEDKTTRQAVWPQAVTLSNLIGPSIQSKVRNQNRSTWTYLDYTFYGGPSTGYNLGVLNGLAMPGELSEGEFHDFFPETRRLMNPLYCKMEAYALRNAFMQYFSVPADTLGIIAGIQYDVATSNPINLTQVRLLPLNRIVTGDSYNNGFYMFDKLPAGTYTVRFETPGYSSDSVQVILGTGATSFVDRSLVSQANPAVVLASPANNDTTVLVNKPVTLSFTKPMDTASVRGAFSINPAVAGTIAWNATNAALTFTPAAYLAPWVTYQIRVDTSARSATGQAFDGNGDGVSGDPFVLSFRTKYMDIFPPAVASASPASLAQLPAPTPVVNITFDEPLNQSTVTASNFLLQLVGGSQQSKTLEYAEANGQGGVTMFIPNGLVAGASYRIRVGGVSDLPGNMIPSTAYPLWQYSIAPGLFEYTVLDSVNPWSTGLRAPDTTGWTGIDVLEAGQSSLRGVGIVSGNPGSFSIRCGWDTTQATWNVLIPLDTASAGGRIRFTKTGTLLRAYVYGDGGKSQVRFCVSDSVDAFPNGPEGHSEASRWIPIDWVGWRALHWDLESDSVGVGGGDGILEGLMRLAGLEFRYVHGLSLPRMQVNLDQIEVIHRGTVSVDEELLTKAVNYSLDPAYPNPFNPTTVVSCQLPVASLVRIVVYDLLGRQVAVLLDEVRAAGNYKIQFDAAGLASGTYIIRMNAVDQGGNGQFTSAQKVMLVR
jgi:N-acetylmuramoyl-L-alanine amidase